jgi:hypothetical protein
MTRSLAILLRPKTAAMTDDVLRVAALTVPCLFGLWTAVACRRAKATVETRWTIPPLIHEAEIRLIEKVGVFGAPNLQLSQAFPCPKVCTGCRTTKQRRFSWVRLI